MPFKMKSWSPFNQFAGSQKEDIVSEIEEEAVTEDEKRKNEWIEKSADANKEMQLQREQMKAMVRKIESVTNAPTDRIHNAINRLKAKGLTPSSEQVIKMLSEMGMTKTRMHGM